MLFQGSTLVTPLSHTHVFSLFSNTLRLNIVFYYLHSNEQYLLWQHKSVTRIIVFCDHGVKNRHTHCVHIHKLQSRYLIFLINKQCIKKSGTIVKIRNMDNASLMAQIHTIPRINKERHAPLSQLSNYGLINEPAVIVIFA